MVRFAVVMLVSFIVMIGCALAPVSDADPTYSAFFDPVDSIEVEFENKAFSSGDTVRLTATSDKYDISRGIYTYVCDQYGDALDTSHNVFDCELVSVSGNSTVFDVLDVTDNLLVVFIDPGLRSNTVIEETGPISDQGTNALVPVVALILSSVFFALLFYYFRIAGNREEIA